jgi:hypothetical protein
MTVDCGGGLPPSIIPSYLLVPLDHRKHPLEAVDAAQQLRRQPHLRREHLDEPPRAEADALGELAAGPRVRHGLDRGPREGDG